MLIDIHTHNAESPVEGFKIINLFARDLPPKDELYYSAGLHPWHLQQGNIEESMQKLYTYAREKNILAIGEAGLDKKIEVPVEKQKEVLLKHISLAEETAKPLVIHCVKAYDEIINLKKSQRNEVPWIIHGFVGNSQQANQLVNQGFYLSFGKAILNDGSKASAALSQLHGSMFFLETDEYKGGVEAIYKKAAEIRRTELEEVEEQITENFTKIFGAVSATKSS